MIIATRNITCIEDDNKVDIRISVFVPEYDGVAWNCKYEIDWPSQKRVSSGFGIDSIQALSLTLQKIGLDIYMSDHHASGRLFWEEIGSGYGFPVPKNGRDCLIGQDKKFED